MCYLSPRRADERVGQYRDKCSNLREYSKQNDIPKVAAPPLSSRSDDKSAICKALAVVCLPVVEQSTLSQTRVQHNAGASGQHAVASQAAL